MDVRNSFSRVAYWALVELLLALVACCLNNRNYRGSELFLHSFWLSSISLSTQLSGCTFCLFLSLSLATTVFPSFSIFWAILGREPIEGCVLDLDQTSDDEFPPIRLQMNWKPIPIKELLKKHIAQFCCVEICRTMLFVDVINNQIYTETPPSTLWCNVCYYFEFWSGVIDGCDWHLQTIYGCCHHDHLHTQFLCRSQKW